MSCCPITVQLICATCCALLAHRLVSLQWYACTRLLTCTNLPRRAKEIDCLDFEMKRTYVSFNCFATRPPQLFCNAPTSAEDIDKEIKAQLHPPTLNSSLPSPPSLLSLMRCFPRSPLPPLPRLLASRPSSLPPAQCSSYHASSSCPSIILAFPPLPL